MNMFTFSVNFVCLLFWAFLAGVYFLKKNMNNYENKIYKYIILLDFILLLTHFLGIIVAYYFVHDIDNIPVAYTLITRIYSISQMGWCIYFAYYMIIAVNETNEKFNNWFYSNPKKNFRMFNLISLVLCVIDFFLPVKYAIDKNGVVVFTGLRIDFITYTMFTLGFICLIAIIMNRKNIKIRKIIPFAFLIVSQLTALFAYIYDPSISIFTLSITLISYFMYHTIENPDIKIIRELELATEQAEKSNNAKSDFLSSMSQEMKTPINQILGLTQVMINRDEVEDMHHDGEEILNESHKLIELVDGILDINSLEADKIELVDVEYNPVEIYDFVVKMANIRLIDKNIELRASKSDLPEKLYGDKEKIKRVISNLITNSIKYTETGYIQFDMNCEKEKDKCTLKITVKDTGKGMSEEQKERVFTNNYTKPSEDTDQNTELGLAITKSIVDIMNGSIKLESKINEGTTFKVEISQKYEKE